MALTDENAVCGGCCTKITGLSVSIGQAPIVRDVNLHLHCGEFSVIMGPNGAGKTTLLRAIAGELPFTGEVLFHRFGDDAAAAQKIKPRIGYVPQRLEFDPAAPMTVEDLFALCLSARPRWLFRARASRQAAMDALAAVDAARLISKRVGHLSGGELQRVILSLALTPRPDILLLDEPVSGVDAFGLNLFYEMISKLRARYDLSIIMVSHDLPRSAKYADRLI
ncbi:MAG: metal ABC transporter ATP-binding protein, partial [Chitinispirillales bacterium]|nr:metal ABC transporter ATP-binding protein [Chitinispirillales bacterium]